MNLILCQKQLECHLTQYLGPPTYVCAQDGNFSSCICVGHFQVYVFPTLIYATEIFFEGSSPVIFGLPRFLFPRKGCHFIATFAGPSSDILRMWPANITLCSVTISCRRRDCALHYLLYHQGMIFSESSVNIFGERYLTSLKQLQQISRFHQHRELLVVRQRSTVVVLSSC